MTTGTLTRPNATRPSATRPGTIAVDEAGDGEPVIMIHGLGGSSNTFQPLMDVLGNFRVIRPDLPGSGRSASVTGPPSLERFAEAMFGLLDDRDIARAHIVGHSLGTIVAQLMAGARPERVATLTLFGALTEPPAAAREAMIARARAAREAGLAGIADQSIAALSPATHRDAPAAVAYVRESIMRQPAEGYAATCEALARAVPADWRRITAPTMLATGTDDAIAPLSMARLLGEKISNARLESISDCGHWTPIERPVDCRRILADFLRQYPM